MAFRPRQPNEDLGAYLKAKQDYEIQTTGKSGVDFGPQGYIPAQTLTQESITGNPAMDETLNVLKDYVQQLTTQGKTLNPRVEITPERMAEFISQASREIDPYYSTQLKLAKDTFLKDLGYTQEDILRQEQDIERQYGQQLRTLGETMAESGFAQSGIRRRDEAELAQSTQQQIEQNRRTLSQAAERTAGQFAQQYGGQAIPTQTITQAPRVLSGISTFERPQGVDKLYQLSPDVYSDLIGEKQFESEAQKRRRASELESSFRQNESERQLRELNFY